MTACELTLRTHLQNEKSRFLTAKAVRNDSMVVKFCYNELLLKGSYTGTGTDSTIS